MKIIALPKPNPSSKLDPRLSLLTISKIFSNTEPLHFFLLDKLSRKIRGFQCDLLLLHHYFDLIYYDIDSLSIIDMPDNLAETAGYLNKMKVGSKLLKTNLAERLSTVDFILVPTKRDYLSYTQLGVPSSRIFIIYNVFPAPFTLSEIRKMVDQCRKEELTIVIDNWSFYLERIRLGLIFTKLFPKIKRIYITSAPIPNAIKLKDKIIVVPTLPREEYLKLLARSSIFIFFPKIPWSGGYSVRLNDAMLMGNIVFGGEHELRGEPYPHTFTYLDLKDLITKLSYILEREDDLYKFCFNNHLEAIRKVQLNAHTFEKLTNIILGELS